MDIKQYEDIIEKHENTIDVKAFLQECFKHWKWFVGCICTTVAIAILFLLVAVPKYERHAAVLIKDENSGGGMLSSMVSNMGMLAGMAGINISSNVNNEMEIFSSPALMMEVVTRLGLCTKYEAYDGLKKTELWDKTLPIKVSMPKLNDKDNAYFKMDLQQDGSFTLYKFRKNEDKLDGEINGKINTVCQTPIGPISVISTKYFNSCLKYHDGDMTIRVTKDKKYNKVEAMMKQMKIDLTDDQTSVISISYEDISGERAEIIINTLIKIYQEEWMKEKQGISDTSTAFINERIGDIERELSGLDSDIANFKGKNMIPDYEQTAKMFMENAALTYEAQVKVNNQLYMMEQMRDYVKRNQSQNEVLPANMLPDNENVASQISDYNKLQLKRNLMVENSNENNPLVKDLDRQLESMRTALIKSLDNGVAQLQAQQHSINYEDQKLKQQIAVTPEKVTKILPAERQHKIVEALYIYLLEKREENNISHILSSKNTRIITPPMGKIKPIFPKKLTTLAASFLLGLILPAGLIFYRIRRKN